MKIAALSDNHENYNFDVPSADLLIHAGDFSYRGKPIEIYNFIEWINKQPHEHKLWIPGNHELSLEDFPYNSSKNGPTLTSFLRPELMKNNSELK